jgi:hypothetical protein
MTRGTGVNHAAQETIGALVSVERETISESASLTAWAGVSAPELEALPRPRATHDAERGLAATRRWHTLTRAQGRLRSAGPRG